MIKFVYNTKMGPGLPWCRQKSPPKIVDFICVLVKLSQIWYILRTCGFPATNELLLSYWKVQCLIYIMSRKLEGSKTRAVTRLSTWWTKTHNLRKNRPHLKDVSSNYISLFHSRIKATKIVKTCSLVFVLCVSEYIEQFVFAWLAARCPAKFKFMINLQNS